MTRTSTAKLRRLAVGCLLTCLAIIGAPMSAQGTPSPKPSPSPTTVAGVPITLPRAKNSEAQLQPNTVHLLRLIEHLFPYYSADGVIGGYRQDAIMDHPSGQALDIMMANDGRDPKSVADGHKVAAFLMANASELGVTYMVWRQNIWYPGRDWRMLDDRSNWTDNHMNHIHVLVNGSFQARDEIVLPQDLDVKLDEMPNGEALRKQHELRVAIILKLTQAQSRLQVAENTNRKLTSTNSKRAKELAAAQMKVGQAVRESYILGMDTDLLANSMMVMSGTSVDPTIAMALERALRTQDDDLGSAVAALTAAARELEANNRELAAARSELDAANKELAELDAT